VYYQSKTKKKMSKKAIAFLVSIIVAVAVLLVGLSLWLSTIIFSNTTGKSSMVQMPFSSDSEYFSVGSNIVYLNQDTLTCVDSHLKTVWQCKLYKSGLKLIANDHVIAATSEDAIQCIDENGAQLFTTRIDGTVQSARVGADKVAVSVKQVLEDSAPAYILIFDLAGNSLYQIPITGKYVLDYGFDSQSDQLYMLELDVTGSVPISRISTYRPETQAMTGIKELKDQLVSDVSIIGKDIYAMGTNRMTIYPAANTGNSRDILTYGWMMEDINSSGDPKFIYIPSKDGAIDIARIIRSSGDETKINLPPNVFRIIDTNDKIYCFANNSFFVYTGEGKFLRSYDLDFNIDGVQRAMTNHVFVTQGTSIYMMTLP
jgi:hypothetical protein